MKRKQLLPYRSQWLGFALLWIMVSHCGISFRPPLLRYLQLWGYGGVDICLFASGLGCYFSLEKNSAPLDFLKRRAQRLLPAYCLFMLLWIPVNLAKGTLPAGKILGNLLGVQTFMGFAGSFNWYISALVAIYLLAPYLKNAADRAKGPWGHGCVLAFLLVLSSAFWGSSHFIVIVSRIPVFYLGMVFAKAASRDEEIKMSWLLFWIALIPVGLSILYVTKNQPYDLLWNYGLNWYPFILITPGLCILISLACRALETVRPLAWLSKFLGLVGRYSFELYLVHPFVFELLPSAAGRLGISQTDPLLWLAALPVIALGTWLLKAGAALVTRFLHR